VLLVSSKQLVEYVHTMYVGYCIIDVPVRRGKQCCTICCRLQNQSNLVLDSIPANHPTETQAVTKSQVGSRMRAVVHPSSVIKKKSE
jgi:hypothetical protein